MTCVYHLRILHIALCFLFTRLLILFLGTCTVFLWLDVPYFLFDVLSLVGVLVIGLVILILRFDIVFLVLEDLFFNVLHQPDLFLRRDV